LSTRSQHEQLSPISSERRDLVRVSIAMQLNSTQRQVELSCVAINGPFSLCITIPVCFLIISYVGFTAACL